MRNAFTFSAYLKASIFKTCLNEIHKVTSMDYFT